MNFPVIAILCAVAAAHLGRQLVVSHENGIIGRDIPVRMRRYVYSQGGSRLHPNNPNIVLAQIHKRAYIPCYIKHFGRRSVSWMRKRDSYIISVDQAVFINDPRFIVHHTNLSDQWVLQIMQVRKEDQGLYECQISGESKSSHEILLLVLVPEAKIVPEGEIHVSWGGNVAIKCHISGCLENPAYVRWIHNQMLLNLKPPAGSRMYQETVRENISVVVSTLTISNAQTSDAGFYVCYPHNLRPANVTLHVLDGENSAAMKHQFDISTADRRLQMSATVFLVVLSLLL